MHDERDVLFEFNIVFSIVFMFGWWMSFSMIFFTISRFFHFFLRVFFFVCFLFLFFVFFVCFVYSVFLYVSTQYQVRCVDWGTLIFRQCHHDYRGYLKFPTLLFIFSYIPHSSENGKYLWKRAKDISNNQWKSVQTIS